MLPPSAAHRGVTVVLSTHRWKTGHRLGSLAAALSVALFFGAASAAPAACKIEQIAEFHVERVAGSPIVEGQVNGQPIRMMLDTGSDISYLTLAAAHQLKLPVHQHRPTTMYGVEAANVNELRIGQLLLVGQSLNVVGDEIHGGNGLASYLLGVDFFERYATEFDLAHGVVRVLRPRDCKLDELAYWTPAFFKVELEHFSSDFNPRFIVTIKVNGKALKAKLVSGSAMTYISLYGAEDAGIEPSSPGVEPAEPFRDGVPTWTARFDTIELGGETIKNARLRMGDVIPAGREHSRAPYDIQLSSDFFQAHRVVIVPDQKAVLFTYNGGTVF
jgi:predicted aspartyl protease